MMEFNRRNVLAYVAVKEEGDFARIMTRIREMGTVAPEDFKSMDDPGSFICALDGSYPESLKHVIAPPIVMFTDGDESLLSEDARRICVVSSDTQNGEGLIEIISSAEDDAIIVASQGNKMLKQLATEAKHRMIIVAREGLDVAKKKLGPVYDKVIKAGGLIISEHPKRTEPNPDRTVNSHRVVAGLSDIMVVSSIGPRHHAMLGVKVAIEMGKDVYVMPASRDLANNSLIKNGAYLIDCADDLKGE